MINNNTTVIETENDVNNTTWSGTYLQGQVNALLVSDRETCPRGCEGPRTYAGVAISARDTSVGEMISDHPP